MSFKQYLKAEIARGLDETYVLEDWAKDHPGRSYYDVHLSTIERHETATPIFRRHLGGGGLRILESGCGTGRWMAFFERLGNRPVGLDDSAGPLRVARAHDAALPLVRADALRSPFRANVFDAAFSSYVAEHFEEGPERLFGEIHRVLKPGGLFFVVVPHDNTFRRLVVDPALRVLYGVWRLRRLGLGFTEFRYRKEEMDGFLVRSGFDVLEVLPDYYRLPWSKGLFVDLCDVGSFFNYEPKPPYEFGPVGRAIVRAIQSAGLWHSSGGLFYVARAVKS
jgi:SAM-dependent methyltransferase